MIMSDDTLCLLSRLSAFQVTLRHTIPSSPPFLSRPFLLCFPPTSSPSLAILIRNQPPTLNPVTTSNTHPCSPHPTRPSSRLTPSHTQTYTSIILFSSSNPMQSKLSNSNSLNFNLQLFLRSISHMYILSSPHAITTSSRIQTHISPEFHRNIR
jgi:hypothetical protein